MIELLVIRLEDKFILLEILIFFFFLVLDINLINKWINVLINIIEVVVIGK